MSKHKEQTSAEAYAEGLEEGSAQAHRDTERGTWERYPCTYAHYAPYWRGYYKAYDAWCE